MLISTLGNTAKLILRIFNSSWILSKGKGKMIGKPVSGDELKKVLDR